MSYLAFHLNGSAADFIDKSRAKRGCLAGIVSQLTIDIGRCLL
jgi:hypothetical protein